MNKRRLTIYLMGVLLGCLILLMLPRKPHKEHKPNPWQLQTAPWNYYPRTLTDDIGRDITLKKQPRLIISLAPSVSDMMVAMGMGDHLIGVSNWCSNPALKDVARIGNLDAPNIEEIAASRPDLVLGTEMTPKAVYDRFDSLGIPAIAFKHQGLDDVLNDMRQLSILLGVPNMGLKATNALEARRTAVLDKVPATGPRPLVAVLYDLDTFGSAGKGTWVGDLLTSLHLDNLAAGATSPWPTLSKETLVARDPDYLILPTPSDAKEAAALKARIAALPQDPLFGQLKAVKDDHIILLSPNLLSVPGPRSIQALAEIANAIYAIPIPPDVKPPENTKAF